MSPSNAPASMFTIDRDRDRRGAPRQIGRDIRTVKISGGDTAGAFALLEYVGRAPDAPPLHVRNRRLIRPAFHSEPNGLVAMRLPSGRCFRSDRSGLGLHLPYEDDDRLPDDRLATDDL